MSQLVRVTLCAGVCAMLAAVSVQAQTLTFQTHEYPFDTLHPAIQVDLNGDGIPDWVAENHSFQIDALLSSGGGTYTAATISQTSSNGGYPIASGDFNGDGKADVFFAQPLGFALGNGSGGLGSFQSIPFSNNVIYAQAQVADFNGDGKPDLALAYDTNFGPNGLPAFQVALFANNGAGFNAPVMVYSQDVPSGSSPGFESTTDLDLVQGNFDTSGHADLALRTTESDPNNPAAPLVNIVILFGDGGGTFIPKQIFSGSNLFGIAAADMNDDGDSDIVANDGGAITIFYIHRDWTWTTAALPAQNDRAITPMLGDFDGEGRKDIVYAALTQSASDNVGVSALLQSAPGTFTQQGFFPIDTYNASPGEVPFSQTFVGDYNRYAQPDVALLSTSGEAAHPFSMDVLLNPLAPPTDSCRPPVAASGISVCSPKPTSTVSNPVTFSFTAISFDPVRKMEVWIDRVKQSETYDVFGNLGIGDVSLTLSPGPHQVDLFAGNFDGTVQHIGYQIDVK